MSRQFWKPQETEILRQMAQANKTVAEIKRVFPSRTESSIRAAGRKLGFLINSQVAPEINIEEFNAIMGVKHGSVRMQNSKVREARR